MQKFSEIPYSRPDLGALKRSIKRQLKLFRAAETYEQAKAAYLAYQSLLSDAQSSYVVASVRNTMDTADRFYDGEMQFFNRALALLMPLQRAFTEALTKTPFRAQFEQEYGAQLMRVSEMQLKSQSRKIIPELIRQGKIENAYKKTVAACKTAFRGEECNFYGLLKRMESSDRAERREAFLAWAGLYEQVAPKLDAQFDKLVKLRVRMARKLGLEGGYTALGYLNLERSDYGPEQVAAFREQVKTVIVPAVWALRRQQAARLGVEKLKYYDETCVYPDGNADPIGDESALVSAAQRMYHDISPETGEFFDMMCAYQLFDLTTRPNKHLGGYCTYITKYHSPFIFSNFNGTAADVGVLTHEAGHAFAGYTAMRCQPLLDYISSTNEINEIHSMTMEHFACSYMKDFFGEENAEKARYAHLLEAFCTIPYLVSVDEFQHRVYQEPSMRANERRKVWREIEQTYMPWRDYDGVSFLDEGGFWMQKQHIFLYPFYYIDYALAQVCAFMLYGVMKTDREAAWQAYMRLCRAGGSKGYFELLALADLPNPFEQGSVERAVGHVIEELNAGAADSAAR